MAYMVVAVVAETAAGEPDLPMVDYIPAKVRPYIVMAYVVVAYVVIP